MNSLLDGITFSSSSGSVINHEQDRQSQQHRQSHHRHRHHRRSNNDESPLTTTTTTTKSAHNEIKSQSSQYGSQAAANEKSSSIHKQQQQQSPAAYSLTNNDRVSQNEEFNVKNGEQQSQLSNSQKQQPTSSSSVSSSSSSSSSDGTYQFSNSNSIVNNQFNYNSKQSSSLSNKANAKKGSAAVKKQDDVLRLKLADLINPNRNQTFIDNLYAQFQQESNRISLIYVPEMQKPPENSVLLNSHLLNGGGAGHNSSLSLTNTSSTFNKTYLSTLDANKLLNEFYMDVKMPKPTYYPERQILASELFLILVVISLWLISVFICLRRYSIFICFHKNDVPFYDASLLNVKLNKDPTMQSNQPVGQQLSCENQYMLLDEKSQQLNRSQSNLNALLANAGGGSLIGVGVGGGGASTLGDSNVSSIRNNSCINMHEFNRPALFFHGNQLNKHSTDYKSISQGNFNAAKLIGNHMGSNYMNIKKLKSNLKITNLYNNPYADLYYPNMAPPVRHRSALLTNVTGASIKLKKKINKPSKLSLTITNYGKQLVQSSNTAAAAAAANDKEKSVVSFADNNESPSYNSNKALKAKRALIRNKHFNLMSLDETALNMYRQQHMFNQMQQRKKQKQKNQNLTVATVLSMASSCNSPTSPSHLSTARSAGAASNIGFNNNHQMHSASRARLTLATPHSNFTSIRSGGSDSENISWLNKPVQSFDFSESNEMLESVGSLHQFNQSPVQQAQLSANQLNIVGGGVGGGNGSSHSPDGLNHNSSLVKLTSAGAKRQINPLSSMRRHMFVNSRRHAQTTVEYAHPSHLYDESVDQSSLDFMNSMSVVSETMPYAISNRLQQLQENMPYISTAEQINATSNDDLSDLPSAKNRSSLAACPETNDPNLLNPEWIPPLVRKTLLEIHERTVLSKSDSNIKSTKYRSSNHLLHSPSAAKNSTKSVKQLKENKKKKPLSLQNSEEKSAQELTGTSMVMTTATATSGAAGNSASVTPNRSFYDELRAKLFQSNSVAHKSSTTNTTSTNISYTNQINESERSDSPNSPSDPTSIVTVVNTHELLSDVNPNGAPTRPHPSLHLASASTSSSFEPPQRQASQRSLSLATSTPASSHTNTTRL